MVNDEYNFGLCEFFTESNTTYKAGRFTCNYDKCPYGNEKGTICKGLISKEQNPELFHTHLFGRAYVEGARKEFLEPGKREREPAAA